METCNHKYVHLYIYIYMFVTMAAAVALAWKQAKKTQCIKMNDGPVCIVRHLLTAMITSVSLVSSACRCSNSLWMARINEEARFSLNEQTGNKLVCAHPFARQLHAEY